ncbi:MAG: carbon storage regulator CsrA [Candidatus Calescibacterium sp.]|jgi:carbon storage regulator
MLVLKRKVGERIIIGENIIVQVVEVEGKSVKIGIEAPQNISIVREELLERVKEKVAESVIKDNVYITKSFKHKAETEKSER